MIVQVLFQEVFGHSNKNKQQEHGAGQKSYFLPVHSFGPIIPAKKNIKQQ
jgi:hypothetical protein